MKKSPSLRKKVNVVPAILPITPEYAFIVPALTWTESRARPTEVDCSEDMVFALISGIRSSIILIWPEIAAPPSQAIKAAIVTRSNRIKTSAHLRVRGIPLLIQPAIPSKAIPQQQTGEKSAQ